MTKPLVASQLLRRLRLRHIELLDVLGTVSSMRLASEQLNLSQPAVSKMLHEIEAVFGVVLFERSRLGITATAVGETAVRQARIIRSEVEVTAEAVAATAAGRSRVLRLGTLTVTAVVPKAILSLRAAHPDAVVKIHEGAVDELVSLLLANELDCVVGALSPGLVSDKMLAHLSARPIALDRLCIVASPQRTLAAPGQVAWTDLADANWVLPPLNTLLRQTFVAACLQRGMAPPAPVVETLSPLTLSHLLRADASLLGIMRSEQMRGEQLVASLRELPVFDRVELPPLSLLTRRSPLGMPPLVQPFLTALEQAVPPDARP